MIEIAQDLDGLPQNLIRPTSLDIDHKTHAASVVLEGGIVETLFTRTPHMRGAYRCFTFGLIYDGPWHDPWAPHGKMQGAAAPHHRPNACNVLILKNLLKGDCLDPAPQGASGQPATLLCP